MTKENIIGILKREWSRSPHRDLTQESFPHRAHINMLSLTMNLQGSRRGDQAIPQGLNDTERRIFIHETDLAIQNTHV